jgi:Ca-activated chloride channel family protein
MNYLFVLDISGSMGQELKLDTSAAAANAFIGSLGKDERFEVMTFNTTPNVLFNDLKNVDEASLAQAAAYVKDQKAGGGTRLDPALQVAFRYAEKDPDRKLNIVMFSDGITEQATQRALLALVQQAPKNVRLFCVGIGNEVDRPLLQQVAGETGGLAAFLSHGDDFKRQAEGFRRKLVRPAIQNVSISFADAEVYDVVPEKLPNLYHGQPLRVYGRYRKAGSLNMTVRGDLDGRAFEQPLSFDLPEMEKANPEIERMWAWHKIQELDRKSKAAGSDAANAAEIVRLGEGYSIATEYTSFLVLENNNEYQRWKIERRNALRTERDRAAQAAVREKLERLQSAALENLGPNAKPAVDSERAKLASAKPQAASPRPAPAAQAPAPRANNQSFNVTSPAHERSGGGLRVGGGAIDPVSGGIALGLAALLGASKRRKRA